MKQASDIVFQVLQSVLVVLIAARVRRWHNQCRVSVQKRRGGGV